MWLFLTLALALTPVYNLTIQDVRPLPSELDRTPVFNSNSPELVENEGILLSTFPLNSDAHLNFSFQGNFDIFAHHVAKETPENKGKTLYLGVIIYNPSLQPVKINILEGASYLSIPDAPFIELPAMVDNNQNNVYSGPGSRVMNDILRGYRQEIFPPQLIIPPQESRMLINLPIPVEGLEPPLNGRSTYMRLYSDGKVYVASLALYSEGDEAPTQEEWEELLKRGELATPRDRAPTPPNSTGNIIYGRVAGVSQGQEWKADLVDTPDAKVLTIPAVDSGFSYAIATLEGGRLGTRQIQSANMLVRYEDTAYQANGNYGVLYNLTLPLHNPSQESKTVSIAIETPIKEDEITEGLRFLDTGANQVFFRGTVEVSYQDDRGLPQTRYFHLVQRKGEMGKPIVTLKMQPNETRLVRVRFIYPPDATPPQVLTIKTID